jgi:hypothetical protein
MGVHKEVRKMFGSSVMNYMIAARTAQGFEDALAATPEERQDILARWIQHKDEYQSEKMKIYEHGGPEGQETGRLSPRGFLQTRHLSFEERKRLHDERKKRREEERDKVHSEGGHRNCPFCRRSTAHKHTPREIQTTPVVLDEPDADQNAEFEHAIHASVAATSRGNPEEDMMIERAIRASIRELQKASGSALSDQEALDRAIQASIAEAGRRRSAENTAGPITMTDEDAEHQAALEKAIQESLMQYKLPAGDGAADVDTDEDENVKLAIKMSKEETSKGKGLEEDDPMLKLALKRSKTEHERARTEEEIVLEHVKKQSLLEEEHRQAMLGKRKETEEDSATKEKESAADEEAFRLAMEESMKSVGGGGASGSAS